MKTTYIAYLRQSTQKQNLSGLGIEAQREIISKHLKEKPIISEFVETEILFCDFPEANKLVLHIISSIAEYEAGLISTRTKQSLKAKQARGAILGKPENLLRNMDKAIQNSRKTCQSKALNNPNNQRAIAMIRLLQKETANLSQIARELNAQGFTTAKEAKFRGSQVRVLIERYGV